MCAAASIGQLPADQLAELERHLSDCPECRGAYGDYGQIAGLEYSQREHDTTLNADEANRYFNSPHIRNRFIARAAGEGIVFSKQVDRGLAASKLASFPLLRPPRLRPVLTAAAVVLVVMS